VRSYSEVESKQRVIEEEPDDGPSEIYVAGGAGQGADATTVRRFSQLLRLTGRSVGMRDDAANGTVFTIRQSGLYAISYCDSHSADGVQIGICLNTAENGTIAPASLHASQRLAYGRTTPSSSGNQPFSIHAISYLNAGDEIRMHASAGIDGAGVFLFFARITRIK
jgi:hypothetical protein